MKLRTYEIGDLPHVVRLFHDTIHAVNLGDYTSLQVEAWAPAQIDLKHWELKLGAEEVIIAERDGVILGFCSWDATGYLDLLYVHRAFQRKGIASKLYAAAERAIRSNGLHRIYTHASVTAQPFFLRQNFRIIKHQLVGVRGVELPNAIMEKLLS